MYGGQTPSTQGTEVPTGGLDAEVCGIKRRGAHQPLNLTQLTNCLTTHFNLCDVSLCFELLDAVTVPSLEMNSQKSNWLHTTEKGHEKEGRSTTTKKEIQQNVLLTAQGNTQTPRVVMEQADAAVWSDCKPGERGETWQSQLQLSNREQNYRAKRHARPYQWFYSASLQQEFIPEKLSHTHLSQRAKPPASDSESAKGSCTSTSHKV